LKNQLVLHKNKEALQKICRTSRRK